MKTVTAFEAKTRFGRLLKMAQAGEEVVITLHQRPVARLMPFSAPDQSSIRAAVDSLKALRRRTGQPLRTKDVIAAIREGRR